MKPLRILFIALTLALFDTTARAQTIFGNAINLNGTNQYVVITNFGNIIPTNEITVEFWANTSAAAGQSAFLLDPDLGGNRLNAHLNYGPPPAQGVIYWDFGTIIGGGRLGSIDAPVNSISNWVHYAFVASQSGNFMRIYTNGVLLATQTGMTPFVRGSYNLDIGGGSNYFSYHGSLDDFRVWNTALSQAQIQANLGVPLTGSETNLLVYYRFDNSGGTVATNSAIATGALYNGVIAGGAPLVASGVSATPLLSSVVTTTANTGAGSLRQAISNAFPNAVITFTNTLSGKTILLSGALIVTQSLTIDASSLPGGIILNANQAGAAFEMDSGSVVLTALTITNGSGQSLASGAGGGIFNAANLTVNRCTLVGNTAGFQGGAIANFGGSLTMTDCTLTGNSAQDGGAIVNGAGSVTLTHCTLTLNHALSTATSVFGGGGIDSYNSNPLTLTNCIIAGNTDAGGTAPDLWMEGDPLVASHCLIGDGTSSTLANGANGNQVGSGAVPINALLAPLGNYGGPTQTMPTQPDSPAIDAGDTTTLAIDQRGFARLAGAAPDIGAVEAGDAIPGFDYTVVTTTNDFLNGLTSTGVSLRSAATFATNQTTITFANPLAGKTIVLTNGEIGLTNNLTIDATSLPGGLTVSGNQASRIFNINAGTNTIAITGLTLTNGHPVGGSSGGGAILINDGQAAGAVLLTDCIISGNDTTATGNPLGGGVDNEGGTVTIQRCTIANNVASFRGGGIQNQLAGSMVIIDSTITGNTAGPIGIGGGIRSLIPLTLTNCTVYGNSAQTAGNISRSLNIINFQNTIIAGGSLLGTGGSGPDVNGAGFNSLDYNLIQDPSSATITNAIAHNIVGVDPLLAPLGNYGGRTPTMPPLPGSPAVDSGVATTLAIDQRGFARTVGPAPDIGATEAGDPIPGVDYTVVSTASDFLNGLTNSGVSLRSAVAFSPSGSHLTFAPALAGQTLALIGGEIMLANLTIDGSGLTSGVTLSGNDLSRIFNITNGVTILTGLTLVHANGGGGDGGAVLNAGTTTINQCTFANNSTGSGGGIFNISGVLTLNECTFSGNSTAPAGAGGGIRNNASVFLNGCTLTANSGGSGGAIWNYSGAQATLNNTIAAENFPEDIVNQSTLTLIGSNILQFSTGSVSGNAPIHAAPHLAPLGNYGGLTPTAPPLPGSPAIDAGSDAQSGFATDQRGFPRLSGAHVDIGAAEAQIGLAGNPPVLKNFVRPNANTVQFTFTNANRADFTVMTSTNVALPLTNWTVLGEVTQTASGQYQFTDTQATDTKRFYQVVSP